MIKTLKSIFFLLAVSLLVSCATKRKIEEKNIKVEKETYVKEQIKDSKEKEEVKEVTTITPNKEIITFLPCPEEIDSGTNEQTEQGKVRGSIKIGTQEFSYNYDKHQYGYLVTLREDSIINYYKTLINSKKDSLDYIEKYIKQEKEETHIKVEEEKGWKEKLKKHIYKIAATIFFILWILALLGFNPFKIKHKSTS